LEIIDARDLYLGDVRASKYFGWAGWPIRIVIGGIIFDALAPVSSTARWIFLILQAIWTI
jgi:hypothetical protein